MQPLYNDFYEKLISFFFYINKFDWKEFIFNGIYRNITDSVDISLDEPIIVDDYEYLVNACKFLSSIDETNKT